MTKVFQVIKHELAEAIVPTVFFFIAFHLVAFSKTLLLESYEVSATGVAVATVGALTVAKAILIADKMPFVDRFAHKPLVWIVSWKTMIFSVFFLVFRFIEELVPLVAKGLAFGSAVVRLSDEVSWPHFWALNIWLLVSLILYCSIRELDNHFGKGSVRSAFFGK